MIARLQLVAERPIPDPARWLLSGANPAQAPAPRILCGEMTRRLGLLNAAARAIRGMGIRILAQSLRGDVPADGEPTIRIERDPARPFAPFLDAAGPRSFLPCGNVVIGYASLMGVVVTWEEPK